MPEQHDGSIASQVEQWAVDTLSAWNGANGLPFQDIVIYDGRLNDAGDAIVKTLTAGLRDVVALVTTAYGQSQEEGDTVTDLVLALFVFIGVRNRRSDGAARRGDGEKIGVNRAIEIVEAALHKQRPSAIDPDERRTTHMLRRPVATLLAEEQGAYVALVEFECKLAPVAS